MADDISRLMCDCGHTQADHAPNDLPVDQPCDLCTCLDFHALDPDERCEVCAGPWHRHAAPDELGVSCPGWNASERLIHTYLVRREFAADDARLVDKTQEMAGPAKAAYVLRERADGLAKEELPDAARVSVGLVADCDRLTAEIAPVIQARELLDSDGPDLDAPHLTVKGEVPTRLGLVTGTASATTDPSDYALFVKNED